MTEHDWLDTQTKELLAAAPPDKLAPPAVGSYGVVLLERGRDTERVDCALRILTQDANHQAPPCPCVVVHDLSLADALQAQFELVCTDSISVFVDDAVLRSAKPSYLDDLYKSLRLSPEFHPMTIRIWSVPEDERGERFLQQFFGRSVALPFTQVGVRKKARILAHWAAKLGARVECRERPN
jgi:hypothetical protein